MKSTSCVFLLLLVSSLIFIGTCNGDQPAAKQPNILWLVGENMKLDLGIYGAKNVQTPHLDGLAEKGQRYTHVKRHWLGSGCINRKPSRQLSNNVAGFQRNNWQPLVIGQGSG